MPTTRVKVEDTGDIEIETVAPPTAETVETLDIEALPKLHQQIYRDFLQTGSVKEGYVVSGDRQTPVRKRG